MSDLASRLSHRVQLTSEGHRPYLDAVESAFGANIDYAMLVKLYGHDAGIVSRPCDVSDLVNLLIESESKKAA